jgi:hypothetical protein
MTKILPLRRITRQRSQIRLTLGLTFIGSMLLLVARVPRDRHLYRYTTRPRVRSYGDSSTKTRSPGKMRM